MAKNFLEFIIHLELAIFLILVSINQLSKEQRKNSQKLKKIKTRQDILNIKLENIYIGDLIYDTYLAKKIPTINPFEKIFKIFT